MQKIIVSETKLTQKDKPKNALDKTHWEYFAFLEEMVNHIIC